MLKDRRGGRLVADLLALAAAPSFGLMALLTFLLGDSQAAPICSHGNWSLPLTGMTPMYLIMAAFHLAPWFRLADLSQGA